MKFEKNIGLVDRAVRIIIGIALIAVGIYYNNWWGDLGLIPLLTAFVSFCPLYSLVGFSTVEKKK